MSDLSHKMRRASTANFERDGQTPRIRHGPQHRRRTSEPSRAFRVRQAVKQNESLFSRGETTPASAEEHQISPASALELSLAATVQHQDGLDHAKPSSALLGVAQKHKGAKLSLSPVLVALVDAATDNLRVPDSSFRQEMIQAVAETIFNDSSSRQRMEQFWLSLQQEQSP